MLSSGKVNCWGFNYYGQLGNNSTTNSTVPVEVSGITNAVRVSSTGGHSCAVLSSGKVSCWGYNVFGQLGNNSTTNSRVPVEVSGITNATNVTIGREHSCAVLSSGKVNCWGRNLGGRLGNNSTTDSKVPVEVSGITNAVRASAGGDYSCAVLSSGKVNCWGLNHNGELGNNSTTDSKVPVEVSGITNAVGVFAGAVHSCAVLSSGKVNCWGLNSNGEVGNLGNNSYPFQNKVPVEVSGITNATEGTAGIHHSCALLSSGKAKCWGQNGFPADGYYPTTVIGSLGNSSVGAGDSHVPVEVSNVSTFTAFDFGAAAPADTTAPSTPGSFTGVPSSPTSSTSATIGFTLGESDGTVECRVDSGSWGACTSVVGTTGSMAVSALAVGSHSVSVRQTDAAGNVSGVGTTASWTVAAADTTAPSTPGSFTGVPSSPTKLTGATIGFTLGESGGTVECQVDSGSWGACSSVVGTTGSFTVSGLADGSHTVSVRQTDSANNVSPVGTSSSWTVDATAPAAPLLSGAPSGSTTLTTASISFSGEVGAVFTCSLDGGAYSACTSPASLTGLSVGAHTFAVRATDAAGNTSAAGSASWTVAAPVVLAPTILTPAAGTKTVVRATVAGKGAWVMKLGLLFSTGGDTRPAAQLLTVQVAVDSSGKPVSAKPSDSQPLPTAAAFTQGVVAWDASGEAGRQSVDAPVWVRVGNRAGKWSGWVKLTR